MIQIGSMACTTHILAVTAAKLDGMEKERMANSTAAMDCINLVRKVGKPCRSALQHAEMLCKMLDEANGSPPQVSDEALVSRISPHQHLRTSLTRGPQSGDVTWGYDSLPAASIPPIWLGTGGSLLSGPGFMTLDDVFALLPMDQSMGQQFTERDDRGYGAYSGFFDA